MRNIRNQRRSCSARVWVHPFLPNNVLRRSIFPAYKELGLPHATWLTFRRTYSSWSHDKGVPGKVVAQLMGHANVDTTLNVYTQVLDGSVRDAVEKVGGELFTIVHRAEKADALTDCKQWCALQDSNLRPPGS